MLPPCSALQTKPQWPHVRVPREQVLSTVALWKNTMLCAHLLDAVAFTMELSVFQKHSSTQNHLGRLIPHPWGPGTPGSSALRNPRPKSPCVGEERRAVWVRPSPTGSPIVGSRVEPVQSDTAVHIITLGARHVRLGRRVITCPCVLFVVRGRDEAPPRESEHSPFDVTSRGWWSPYKPLLTHSVWSW